MQNPWSWLAVAYLCGSIPFGLLIGRFKGVDVRKAGSGNIGATNVGRVLGKKWGILCFVLDVLKGMIPTLLAGITLGFAGKDNLPASEAWQWLSIGAMAMMGHIFPVWLGFKGGKGVATALGILFGIWPVLTWAGLAGGLTWLLVVAIFRYVSLASILASLLVLFYIHIIGVASHRPLEEVWPYLAVCGTMALLIVLRHRGNILRLCNGTEAKLGSRAQG